MVDAESQKHVDTKSAPSNPAKRYLKIGIPLVLILVVFFFFALPWIDRSKVRSGRFRPLFRIFFWIFLADGVVLGWCGSQPAEGIALILSRLATFWYFFHFIVLWFLPKFERPVPMPASISTPGK